MRFALGSVRAALIALGVLLAVLSPTRALAQTAADKATARKLAIEGIELYKAHKYGDALDKLQRAEQLYDAPIHLVYMARCQAELGQFVEATENYRKLTRTQLDKDAPDAFKEAVADAKKELPTVEPKVAGLTIEVTPAGVEGLKLDLDGVNVSSAVLGVERPTNPGTRKLTASAPGYKSSEQTIELAPGENKSVKLALEADGSAKAPAGGGAKTGGKTGEKREKGKREAEGPPASPVGFLVGLRVGGALTGGQISKDQAMSDYFGSAGAGELRAGVRLFQHYTILLMGAVNTYQAGAALKKLPGSQSRADTQPIGTDAGAGVMYSAEPGTLGPFAELDVLFVHRFEAKRDLTINDPAPMGAERCTQTLKAFGGGFRLGGGVQIPLLSFLQLSPYGSIAIGQLGDVSSDDDCKNKGAGLQNTPWEAGKPFGTDQRGTHFIVSLGVGGDLLFGGDIRKK
jgi:hypothetical protein